MAIHDVIDIGKVLAILDCNEEAPYVDEGMLDFLLQDEVDPSVGELNASTYTDKALQKEQKPVLLERFK